MNTARRTARQGGKAALWLAVALAAPAAAQQMMATGHALDSSLQLGSGGYNGTTASGARISTAIYDGVGSSAQNYSTFLQERMYSPARTMASGGTPVRPDSGSSSASASVDRYTQAFSPSYTPIVEGAPPKLSPEAQKQMEMISYGLAYLLGDQLRRSLERDDVKVAADQVIEGFRDGVFENPPRIPQPQMEVVLADAQRQVETRVAQGLLSSDPDFRRVHDENLRHGREFQEACGRRPGMVSLPNGLQYKVVRAGSGPSPKADDMVIVNYRALKLDGSVLSEGQGHELSVGTAIPGAAQVLQMMNVGARWQVVIPPALAHGSAGRFPDVGPNETLFGEVELLEIKPPA